MSDYRDPKPIDTQSTTKKIPERIKKLASYIRTKMYGKDTREAMAQVAEEAGAIALESVELSESTEVRQTKLENKWDYVLAETTDGDEVIDGREDAEGNIHPTIGKNIRANQENVSKQLAETSEQLENDSTDIISTILMDVDFEVTGRIEEPITSMLVNIASRIPSNTLNIGFITDIHFEGDSGGPWPQNCLPQVKHIAELTNLAKVDAVIAGGDNTDGGSEKNYNLKLQGDVCSILQTKSNSDVFILKGNHDDSSLYSKNKGNNTIDEVLTDNELATIYGANSLTYGEIRDGNSLYFYKDYPEKKIRVIGVNTADVPLITLNGKNKYPAIDNSGLQHTQLNWLANTALQIPSQDWHVIIFSHHSFAGVFHDFRQYNTTIFKNILKSFINGTSELLTSNTADFSAIVQTNFSKQGQGTLIALVSGHHHWADHKLYEGINCILTECSLAFGSPRDSDPTKTDSWNVYTIDRNARKMKIFGFGNSKDREITY